MEPNKIIRFVINNLIYIEKKSEYEILLIYIDNQYRKSGYDLIQLYNFSQRN